MFRRMKDPICFQGHLNKNYFEGWYYKFVTNDQTVSLSFIQYILVEKQMNGESKTLTGSCCYPVESFRTSDYPFSVSIGESTFSVDKVNLTL